MSKQINIEFNKGEKLSFAHEKAARAHINRNDVYTVQKAIHDRISYLPGSPEQNLNKIISNLSEAINTELLFIDSWPRRENGVVNYQNVVLVLKFSDKSTFHTITKSNSLALYCSASVQYSDIKLKLNRIELFSSSEQISGNGIDVSDFKVNILEFGVDIIQPNFELRSEINLPSNIAKQSTIDFFEKKSRIRLNEFKSFITPFNDFLKEKSREKEPLFSMNNEISYSTKSRDNKVWNFCMAITNPQMRKILDAQSVVLSNSIDPDVTIKGKIGRYQVIDMIGIINNYITEKKDEISNHQYEIESINTLLQSEEISKKTQYEKSKILDLKFQDINSKFNEINQQISLKKQELDILTKKIIKPKTKKKKKSKNTNTSDEVVEQQDEIESIKKMVSEIESELTVMNKQFDEISNERNILITSIEKNEIELNSLVLSIKKNTFSLHQLQLEITNLSSSISRFEKLFEKKVKGVLFTEIQFYSCDFIPFVKDGDKEVLLTISNTDIEEGKMEFFYTPEWEVSSFDYGTLVKYKRYSDSINNITNGFYRNPYLVYSLLKPSTIDENSYAWFERFVSNDQNLNEKQKMVVTKSLATNDISYLQGPPGTGKTQTLASIANIAATTLGENIIISSSTHAAINNFFARLDEKYKDNPNLFMFRYVFKRKDNTIVSYDEGDVFKRFLNSIDINISKNINSNKEDISEYINFKKNIENLQANDSNLNFWATEKLLKNITTTQFKSLNNHVELWDEITESSLRFKDKIDIAYVAKVDEYFEYMNSDKKQILNNFEKLVLDMKNKIGFQYNFDNYITPVDLLKYVNSFIENTAVDDGLEIIDSFKKYSINIYEKYEKNKSNVDVRVATREEDNFLRLLINKNLLNIIGITTTSRKELTFAGNDVHLFHTYKIDRILIDEVSKSTTPEILSNIQLANKITLAGDYRQLNPNLDIDDSLLLDFMNSDNFEKFAKHSNLIIDNSLPESNKLSLFKEYLIKLYEDSLFKNQIVEIKSNHLSQKKSAYQFLNMQFRFTKQIMDIINMISYFGDEALILGKDSFDEKLVDLKLAVNNKNWGEKGLAYSFNVIDTTNISADYIEYLTNSASNNDQADLSIIKSLTVGMTSFDQVNSLLSSKDIYNSSINEFNAYVIATSVNALIKSGVTPNQIGVISMTRSQVKIIRNFINDICGKEIINKGLIVDTVDNFQGSESDVVFVDLVRAPGKYVRKQGERAGAIVINDGVQRNLDFYQKVERLNVALSRAKSKLFVVGAGEYLARNVVSDVLVDEKIEKKKIFYEMLVYALGYKGAKKW